MIVVQQGERLLMDRAALAQWTKRSVNTIRARCTPFSYEKGRAMYDAHESWTLLEGVPARRRVAA